MGNYVDIALNSASLATVAYYERDSYQYSGNLKIAYQRLFTYLPLVMRGSLWSLQGTTTKDGMAHEP